MQQNWLLSSTGEMCQQMSDPQQSVQGNSRESSSFENWLKKDPTYAVITQSAIAPDHWKSLSVAFKNKYYKQEIKEHFLFWTIYYQQQKRKVLCLLTG